MQESWREGGRGGGREGGDRKEVAGGGALGGRWGRREVGGGGVWGEGSSHESWSRCMGSVSLCCRPAADLFFSLECDVQSNATRVHTFCEADKDDISNSSKSVFSQAPSITREQMTSLVVEYERKYAALHNSVAAHSNASIPAASVEPPFVVRGAARVQGFVFRGASHYQELQKKGHPLVRKALRDGWYGLRYFLKLRDCAEMVMAAEQEDSESRRPYDTLIFTRPDLMWGGRLRLEELSPHRVEVLAREDPIIGRHTWVEERVEDRSSSGGGPSVAGPSVEEGGGPSVEEGGGPPVGGTSGEVDRHGENVTTSSSPKVFQKSFQRGTGDGLDNPRVFRLEVLPSAVGGILYWPAAGSELQVCHCHLHITPSIKQL